MAHSEEDFHEILNAESFVDREALAAAAKDGVPAAVRAEAWKYLLAVSKPDRSQELSAERDRNIQDYLRQDKHNVDVLQRVRAELRRSTVRRDARDPERSALLSSAELRSLAVDRLVAARAVLSLLELLDDRPQVRHLLLGEGERRDGVAHGGARLLEHHLR